MLQALQLEGNYGPFICYAFTVNYILGVGCLGIPYAFLQCGIVLGSTLVIVLSIVSYMTVMWVAQTFQQELLMNSYLSNSNPFILSPVIKRKSPIPPGLSSSSIDETQPILAQSLKNNLYSSLSNFGAVLQSSTEQQEAKKLMLAEQGKDFIEKKRKAAGRSPRKYESIEAAFARMIEENAYLTEEQARHLTVHGVNRNEDGTYSWKFDPHLNVWPVEDIGDEFVEALWGAITSPTLLLYGADSWASNPAKDGRIAHFKTASVIEFEKAGHWLHHDQFDRFIATLRDFL